MIDASHTRLARNTALSLVAIALLGVSRLVYNVVVGRRFGSAALGQATLAINAAMFATLLVSGGWQASSAKYLSQSLGRGDRGEAAGIYRRALLHNTAGGVVLALVVAIALDVVPGVRLDRRDALIAGAIALVYNAYQHLKASAYGFGRVDDYLRLEIVSSGGMLVALGAVAALDVREWILVPVAGAYAVFAAMSLLRLRADAAGAKRVPAERWREIRGFTLLAIAGTVASAGFLNLSPVFAGRYDTAASLGRFSAALALVLPLYFLPRALSMALFPSISYRFGQERTDEVSRQLDVTGRSLSIVLLAPCVVAAALSRLLLRWLFGGSYEAGADVLAVLLAATYLSVAQIPYVTALSGTERRWYKVPVLASLLGFGVGLVLWTTLGAREGAIGVAWGYLIGSIPQAAIPIAFASKVFGVRVTSVFARAGAVWGVMLAARLLLGPAPSVPASFAAAGVVLGAFAVAFARDLATLAADLRRRVRRRRGQADGSGSSLA